LSFLAILAALGLALRILGMFLILLTIAYLLIAFLTGGPYVPLSPAELDAMLYLAKPQEGELWIDLGSGTGWIGARAARHGARSIGYEINPVLVLLNRLRIRLSGLAGRAEVRQANFWFTDLSKADVVSVYLITYRMPKLQRKLAAELKPGSRVLSVQFPLPDWKPAGKLNNVYLYVVPDKRCQGSTYST